MTKIHEILTDKTKWTQGADARDTAGGATYADDPDAQCWCLLGAVRRRWPFDLDARGAAYDVLAAHIDPKGTSSNWKTIVEWNDAPERTFDEVRALVVQLDV